MESLNMIYIPRLMEGGRLITPARSIVLLPLADADPIIQLLVQKGKT
jgi:hypothetical protein